MSSNFQREIGGRLLSIETGKLATLANGAVTVTYGETVVLATACVSPSLREGGDFLPLTIDFEERLYAKGKIPGSFFRREGRPTQEGTLTCRLIDRPLRPLFPKGFRNDIQVVVTVLSADQENEPDVASVIGASAALSLSEIPFKGPVGAVKVGSIDGQFVINPTFSQLQRSQLELVVAATKEAVVMLECGANEVNEELLLEAIALGHEECKKVVQLQEEMVAQLGKPKMSWSDPNLIGKDERDKVVAFLDGKLDSILRAAETTKGEREAALDQLEKGLQAALGETLSSEKLQSAFDEVLEQTYRGIILEGRRPAGRGLKELRPISAEAGVLPRTHGSGLFNRGQTQVMSITTLGTRSEEQRLDGLSPQETRRYMHHYNFPPYSTGEVRRLGSPSRRSIGHGALAERALLPVLPSEEEFPYTIRVVSEVLSSNGSTSMASVCGSSLSLMDCGVPIKAPVAGIAMGLIAGPDGRYAILTDIEGMEDHIGDMDFKVAGSSRGITALQLDIKTQGLSFQLLKEAMAQASEARLAILERMRETIAAPRPDLSPHAPRIFRITIDPGKIGEVIGPGGRMIRSIQERTGVDVDIEDDGAVFVSGPTKEGARKAIDIIEGLTKEFKVGEVYTGRVSRLVSFGAFVEILPGKEGLVPLEELSEERVRSPSDVVRVGDEITVKVVEIDRLGRLNLSRRAVNETGPRTDFERRPVSAGPAGPGDPGRRPDFGPRAGGRGPGPGFGRGPQPPR